MAVFNEILVGRINRAVQKFFGMKGGPPASQLAGDVSMQMQIPLGAEWYFLEGWYLYGSAASSPANAANTSAFRFRNPTNSGVVAIIERAVVTGDALPDTWGVASGLATTSLANVAVVGLRDQRNTAASPTSIFSSANTSPAIVGNGIMRGATAASQTFEFVAPGEELVVAPGASYDFFQNTINQAAKCSIFWRERAIEESEKT